MAQDPQGGGEPKTNFATKRILSLGLTVNDLRRRVEKLARKDVGGGEQRLTARDVRTIEPSEIVNEDTRQARAADSNVAAATTPDRSVRNALMPGGDCSRFCFCQINTRSLTARSLAKGPVRFL